MHSDMGEILQNRHSRKLLYFTPQKSDNRGIFSECLLPNSKIGLEMQQAIFKRRSAFRRRWRLLLGGCISLCGVLASLLAFPEDGLIPLIKGNSKPVGTGVIVLDCESVPRIIPSIPGRTGWAGPHPRQLICLVPTTVEPQRSLKAWASELDSLFQPQILDTITCWEAQSD